MTARRVEGAVGLRELVGQEAGVSGWLTVPQALIDTFADATQDRQWIHINRARAAAESPYRTTIAHGFLTLALVSHLHSQAVEVVGFARTINYGLNRVRFPAPVPSGARVRCRSTLASVEDVAGGVQAAWSLTVEVEGNERPALVAEWLLRYYV